MNFMCLVYHEQRKLEAISEEALAELCAECAGWIGELQAAGKHVSSAALQSTKTAKTVREGDDGELTAIDGPFAETKEFLGGFTILEAKDLDEAMSWASRCPAARLGTIEVRPVFSPDGELTDPMDQKIAAALRGSAQVLIHP